MAVSSASTQNYRSLIAVFQELGRSIDVQSQKGEQVSAAEAEKVIARINDLDPKAKLEATEALKQLAADGFISISDEGKEAFAKAFNIAPRALTARETAQRAGLAAERSIFKGYMQTLTKVPQIDKKYMENIIQGLEQTAPKEMQQLMAALIRDMNSNGLVKLDTNARKSQAKWIGKLDQDGGVSKWSETLNAPQAPEMSAFQRALARGGFFEDILAAFLFMLIGQIQEDTTEKMEELDAAGRRKDDDIKKKDQAAKGEMSELMKNTLKAEGASAEYTHAQIKETQRDLEAVVAVADDALKDGIIGPGEAIKIRKKLERIDPPVDKLIALSMQNALRRSGLDLENGNIAPVAQWVKEKLGADTDLSPLPPADVQNPNDPVLAELANSDKLQDRFAGFLIDAFQSSTSTLGEKVKAMNKLVEDMNAHPECKEILGQLERGEISKEEASNKLANDGHNHDLSALDDVAAKAHSHEAEGPQAAQAQKGAEAAHAEGPAQAAAGAKPAAPEKSRQALMEELKQLQNELSQVLQAVSNILNNLHQNAMNSIRAIR